MFAYYSFFDEPIFLNAAEYYKLSCLHKPCIVKYLATFIHKYYHIHIRISASVHSITLLLIFKSFWAYLFNPFSRFNLNNSLLTAFIEKDINKANEKCYWD